MLYPAELRGHSRQSGAPERTTGSDILAHRASRQTASMLCSPPPATTLASSCAGSEGFCAPCCRRSSQRSRIHNRPKTGRALLLHERLIKKAAV